MMTATWTKPRSGAWGIRYPGTLSVDQEVTVVRASGEHATVAIDAVVWTDGKVTLAAVRRVAAAPAAPRGARGRRSWRPCGYPGCSPSHCDECDGEGGGSSWGSW